jgi:DNA-binding NarL/FixJ family response regulator
VAQAEDIALVGEAATGEDVRQRCGELAPDVVLLDLQMPGPAPSETVAYLHEHCPSVRVLVLTAHDDDAYVQGLLAAGVAGYVLKDEAPETLLHAIRAVAVGGAWFSQGVAAKLARSLAAGVSGGPALTRREEELLAALERGWDNARIAAALDLSEQTVRNYLSRLYAKLNVHSRVEAMLWRHKHAGPDAPM